MADTGRSLQMHADRVSFEEADIQIELKPVRLLQHRMTAESPHCEFDFCAASTRSAKVAAPAKSSISQCGEETRHSNKSQQAKESQFT